MMNDDAFLEKVVTNRLNLATSEPLDLGGGVELKTNKSFPIFSKERIVSNAPPSLEPIMFSKRPVDAEPVKIYNVPQHTPALDSIYNYHRNLPIMNTQVNNLFYKKDFLSSHFGIPRFDINIENYGARAEGALNMTSKDLQTKQWRKDAAKEEQTAYDEEREKFMLNMDKIFDDKPTAKDHAAGGGASETASAHDKLYEADDKIGGENPMRIAVKPAFATSDEKQTSGDDEKESDEKTPIKIKIPRKKSTAAVIPTNPQETPTKKAFTPNDPQDLDDIYELASVKLERLEPKDKLTGDEIKTINEYLVKVGEKKLPNAVKTKTGVFNALAKRKAQQQSIVDDDDDDDEVDEDIQKPNTRGKKERIMHPVVTYKYKGNSLDELYQHTMAQLEDDDVSDDIDSHKINYINSMLNKMNYKSLPKSLTTKYQILHGIMGASKKSQKR